MKNKAEKENRNKITIFAFTIFFACIFVRIIPAFMVYGTEDVSAWHFAISVLEQGKNPYSQSYVFNWSPLWLMVIFQLFKISNIFKIPYYGLIKIIPIICDAIISVIIYKIFLNTNLGRKKAITASLLYALNPISIIITSIHGNFISIPLVFLVISAYILHRKKKYSIIYSSLILGVAIMSKVWPVLFLPVLVQKIKTLKNKLVYVLLSAVPFIISILPLYLKNRDIVIKRFLKYESIPGWYGFTGIGRIWNSELLKSFSHFYVINGMWVLGSVVILLYLIKTYKMDLFRGFCLICLAFLFFTKGFGPQYLVWILPFAIITRDRMLYPFTLLVTIIFIIEYGFRPFLGGFGAFVSMNSPILTMEEFIRDNKLTNILRLPLWIFIGIWLVKMIMQNKKVKDTRCQ